MYTVLICDDQPDIVNALKIYLSSEGYRLLTASNGLQAVELAQKETVHLILLDIMMPQMDGIAAAAKIREFSNVPIIFLTAKSETEDLVLGLNIGADDYITKPFVPVEVLARVRSQLRRYAQLGSHVEERADQLRVGSILQNPGKVYSTRELYEAVWQEAALGSEGSVAVHIRHLREKIEIDPSAPRYLKVIWGQGYKLEGGK